MTPMFAAFGVYEFSFAMAVPRSHHRGPSHWPPEIYGATKSTADKQIRCAVEQTINALAGAGGDW